jgi:hypothetical protein
VGQPHWQALRDLTLPPELAKEVEDICREGRYRKGRDRRRIEEDIKLQHFYGGQCVGILDTPEGMVIVVAGNLASDAFGSALDALAPEVRRNIRLYSPTKWNDDVSSLPMSFFNED